MTKLPTNEEIAEIQRIVESAPECATHYDGGFIPTRYFKIEDNGNFYVFRSGKWEYDFAPDFEIEAPISMLRSILAQQQEIERLRNPWISVEDELPSIEGDRSRLVLIRRVYKNGTVSFTTSFLWSEAKKMSFSFNEPYWQTDTWNAQESNGYTVTHWMPLPKTPKENNDE